jgi:hypothetical protein
MRHIKALPSLETLQKYLNYDPASGDLTWRAGLAYAKQRQAGAKAGTMSKGGYLRTSIERSMYANNRISWKMHYGVDPSGVIDHEDGNKLNNRIDNLRDTTQVGNVCNAIIRSDNTTGYKGVIFDKRRGLYTFNLKLNGIPTRRRHFDSPEEANDFVRVLREEVHGKFTCHGDREARV